MTDKERIHQLMTLSMYKGCPGATKGHLDQRCWEQHYNSTLGIINHIWPDIEILVEYNPRLEALENCLEQLLRLTTAYWPERDEGKLKVEKWGRKSHQAMYERAVELLTKDL